MHVLSGNRNRQHQEQKVCLTHPTILIRRRRRPAAALIAENVVTFTVATGRIAGHSENGPCGDPRGTETEGVADAYLQTMLLRRALLNILLLGPLCAQEPPVFRATSELVLLDVQVLHTKTHAPAPSLRARDFRIFEEGAPQDIVVCSRDEFPLSVVLLFDLTDSVQSVLQHLAEGARTALEHFKPEDEISVMVYSGGATLGRRLYYRPRSNGPSHREGYCHDLRSARSFQ